MYPHILRKTQKIKSMDFETKSAPGSENASVLILVLVLVTILTALVLSGVVAVGSYTTASSRLWERGRARRAALQALNLFVLELGGDADQSPARNPSWSGEQEPVETGSGVRGWISPPAFAGGGVRGALDCESRVNLNTAGRDLLRRVFTEWGELDDDSAGRLAEAVLAWRGDLDPPEALHRETQRYRTAKVDWHPPGRPLACLETLRLIPGGESLDLERLAAWVTVHGSGKINLNTARIELLKTVFLSAAGDNPESARRLVERLRKARSSGVIFESFPDSMSAVVERFGVVTPGEVVLWNRIAPLMGVSSTGFEGRVAGGVDAIGPDARGEARFQADFVWDAARRRIVYWRERELF